MKSNPSPSAPLNLCAPVGVTGTILPASPEGVDCVPDESVCRDCGVSHKDQIALFPVNSTVIALCDIPAPHEASTRNVEKGTLGHISDHCDDGRAFVRFDVGGCHTFHKPEGYIAPHPSPAEPVKVPASPVKDTPAGFVGVLIAPDGTRHFSCYATPGMTLERTGAMEFASREAAEKACLFRLGKGDAFWNSERSARESMAKEMVGWAYVVEPATAPASPVDSVGVSAPIMGKLDARLLPWKVAPNGLDICGARLGEPIATFHADHFAPREARELAAFAVTACNSHAAKDAKIKALEKLAALKTSDDMSPNEHAATDYEVAFDSVIEAARAALALPCAPQES